MFDRTLRAALVAGALGAGCGGSGPEAAGPAAPSAPGGGAPPAPAAAKPASGARPAKGDRVGDFVADALYTDDQGVVTGVRWVHATRGMPVVTLRIQSSPQVFLHVNTPPVSDRGEPHTGEHLLLGKGRRGKQLAGEQDMSFVGSTAWTSQTSVIYAWNCAAGKDTFLRSVRSYLEALLVPDYNDEEIRREVCNLGVSRDAKTGALSLDEKGTIYNEMVSSYERRWAVWRTIRPRLWGPSHPLSYSSGGEPAAVRTMVPKNVHDFHAAHYHLSANVGLIAALPDTVPEREFLERLSKDVAEVVANPAVASRKTDVPKIPPARPEADRALRIEPFPNANENDVGIALLAWPPVPMASPRDQVVADALLEAAGGGPGSTLYARLMDGATREVQLEASDLSAGLDDSPVDLTTFVTLDGFSPRGANEKTVGEVIRIVRDEFTRIAALKDGSPELAKFNEIARTKVAERERSLRKQLSSPPLFGFRMKGGFWFDHLKVVDRQGGFERPVTLAPILRAVREEIDAGRNPWRAAIERLHLTEEPYASVSVPSPELLAKKRSEKAARLAAAAEEIRARFGAKDVQEGLTKFAAEYDAHSAELDQLEKGLPKPKLAADVPLSIDPTIKLEPIEIAGVKGHQGVFEGIDFVETSLCFDVGGLPRSAHVWLPILPSLLTEAGYVDGERKVPYDEMKRRVADEVYELSADYAMRPSRDRHELRVTASGLGDAEAERAVAWIERVTRHAWLDESNLPRLRDLVAEKIRAVRKQLGGSEESWVNNPAGALRFDGDETYLSATGLHTQLLHLVRLEWRLMDTPANDAERDARQQTAFGMIPPDEVYVPKAEPGRPGAEEPAPAKPGPGDEKAVKWRASLEARIRELTADMPPDQRQEMVTQLAALAVREISVPPADALADLRGLMTSIFDAGSCRLTLTGSSAQLAKLRPRLATFLGELHLGKARAASAAAKPGVVHRNAAARDPSARDAKHFALVHGAGTSGVLVLSAEAGDYGDLKDDTLLTDLAARVLGGQGPHGLFMKTWGAGLAYSNGIGVGPQEGRIRYYAERCPDLVETMKFVSGVAKDAAALDDPWLAEYAVANAVAQTRVSDRFEARTRAMADDLVDGDTDERVGAWRRAVVKLRERPDLWPALRSRITASAARVLPGAGARSADVREPVFLAIAPEPLLSKWDEWLRQDDGAKLVRVWPSDFWIRD